MNETNLNGLMNIEDNFLLYNGSKNDKKMDHITQCKAITTYMLQTQKPRTQRLFMLKTFNYVNIETDYINRTSDRKGLKGFTTI